MLSDVTGSQVLARPSQLLLLLLAVSVAGDALGWSVTLLKGEWASPPEPRRPRVIAASNYFGRFMTRLATAHALVRNVLLVGIILTGASSGLSSWVIRAAITLFVVQSAFLVLGLVVSYTAFPISVGLPNRVASIGSRIVVVLVYLAQVTVAYAVCSQLWNVLATSTWAEYRFTALAAISIWLLGRLANRESQQRVLDVVEQPAQGARPSDRVLEPVGIARLRQKLVRGADRGQHGLLGGLPRQKQPNRPGMQGPHPFEQFGAFHHRHAHIGHDDVERGGGQLFQRLGPTLDERHVPPTGQAPQHAPQALQDHGFVVHEQDLALHSV